MKKIEELKTRIVMFERNNFHSENHALALRELIEKVSELIDAHNSQFKEEGKCFSYCSKFSGEECNCLLGQENKKKEEQKIKGCAFCESQPNIIEGSNLTAIYCSNVKCITRTSTFIVKEEAIRAWNTRA